ncbi:PX domain-containing protein 1-like [Myxocyprinus asiaticus]|uniref:PX domain-containing protein 1-like n=1 Tax=Myxocyprinus asiaticus TaxID=70543 RepID=UPI002222B213|nr:PX domain-containing protein 1-like [Myxocyprinus asiaticus]
MERFPDRSANDCWVVGLERFALDPVGEDEGFFEIRTEWSEKSITYVRRRYHDLVKLTKKLRKSFKGDRESFTESLMLEALQRIKEAEENNDIEARLDEVEKLLRNIIKLPQKYSQSEAVLTFFKISPLDYTLKTMYEPVQSLYQSPVTVADVRRANGFCLANTETVIFDAYLLEEGVESSSVHSSKYSFDIEAQKWTGEKNLNGIRCDKENGHKPRMGTMTPVLTPSANESKESDCHPKKSQITTRNLTYLHLQACETDILE